MNFQADPAPLAIFDFIRGPITEDILILELDCDLGTDVGKLINGFRKEGAASSEVGKIFDGGPASATGSQTGVVVTHDADSIKLDILFLDEVTNIGEGIAA